MTMQNVILIVGMISQAAVLVTLRVIVTRRIRKARMERKRRELEKRRAFARWVITEGNDPIVFPGPPSK